MHILIPNLSTHSNLLNVSYRSIVLVPMFNYCLYCKPTLNKKYLTFFNADSRRNNLVWISIYFNDSIGYSYMAWME